MDDKARDKEILEAVQEVVESSVRVAAQRRRIALLKRRGYDIGLPREVLKAMLRAHASKVGPKGS